MEEIAPLLHARIRGRTAKRAHRVRVSQCAICTRWTESALLRNLTRPGPAGARTRFTVVTEWHTHVDTLPELLSRITPLPPPAPLGWRKVGVCFFLKHGEVAVVQLPQRETLYCTLCTFSIPSRNAREYIRVCLKPREKAVRSVPSERNEL